MTRVGRENCWFVLELLAALAVLGGFLALVHAGGASTSRSAEPAPAASLSLSHFSNPFASLSQRISLTT
jgi:hypothetical protein